MTYINVFDNPQKYRSELLAHNWIDVKKNFNGKPLICVFFTSYCVVGCPFCFFHSPDYRVSCNDYFERENRFSPEAVEKFIKFANDSNVGYLQISGGGEPFLEFDSILICVQNIHADRIILVTSGFWAKSKSNAEHYLAELYTALLQNQASPRLTIRLSVSSYHSIRLKENPLINLIDIFKLKYRNYPNFTLQIKFFEEDNTLAGYLEKYYPNHTISLISSNGTDDEKIIKIMPWKYKLTLDSGYEIILGQSRIFNPSLYPNLNDEQMTKKNIEIYDIDLDLSQNDYPSIAYNSDGSKGLDWIVEYNGNVCTWQNRVQDNLLNIYEDDYSVVKNSTLSDLITYSFLDKGSKYRESIVSEISPRMVKLMKTVNIRDYASTLLFGDEKIRLYYNIRVLQDYISDNVISREKLSILSNELVDAILMSPKDLKNLFLKASYSILDQEFAKPINEIELYDFLCLVNYGHYELNEEQISLAIKKYNSLSPKKTLDRIEDAIADPNGITAFERRLTNRVMTRKFMKSENNTRTIILCRHGETNWNVEGRIKGQIDGLETVFTTVGINQIHSVATFISDNEAEAIFTSDLYRTVETSKLINASLNLPLYFCDKFRGLNMGVYQGQLMKDFLNDKNVCQAFRDYDYVIPGGESINQLINRFMLGLDLISETGFYKTVAVISHGAAISNIKSYLSGEQYEDIDFCIIVGTQGNYNVISSGTYRDFFNAEN